MHDPRRQVMASLVVCAAVLLTVIPTGAQPLAAVQLHWTQTYLTTRDLCINPDLELQSAVAIEDVRHTGYARHVVEAEKDLSHHHTKDVHRLLDDGESARDLSELLKRIYSHDLLLSPTMLDQGLSNLGDVTKLRRVLHKLLAGQPITIVLLGGSISRGNGNQDQENTYFRRVSSWINTTFPHPQHVFLNKAFGAATSSYVSPCVLDLVPENTDLVLLEFTFNDSEKSQRQLDDPTRRGLERLLRKLMRQPHQPALVYVHYWAIRSMRDYADTVEDYIDILLKYYGIMGLSMRTALHRWIHQHSEMVAQLWWPALDMVHPTCIGSRYVADLIIGHFQNAAAQVVMEEHSFHNRELASASQESLNKTVLLPPLLPGNWGNLTESCALEDAFKPLVTPGKGFEWTDEGRGKWGFVANTARSQLVVRVPTDNVTVVGGELLIGLGFLMSYQHMGMALVQCFEGCTCLPKEFAFTLPSWWHISMPVWKTLRVTLLEGYNVCALTVTVLERTKSREEPPERKVKLMSLMLTGETDFVDTWTFCDDCLNEFGQNIDWEAGVHMNHEV